MILALEFMADAASESKDDDAQEKYEELKELDNMRSGYWEWRKGLVAVESSA